MGIVNKPHDFTPSTTISSSEVNDNFDTIYDEFNGNIAAANLASNAVTTAKLADSNVTTDKIADSAVTTAKINAGAVDYTKLASGVAVQHVYTETGAVATGTTTIPFDDTIPQNTEGDQYMTLAITPKSATNILVIEVTAWFSCSAAINQIMALFQDTTANALAAGYFQATTTNQRFGMYFKHIMVAGTTSSTTFKMRSGGSSASTTTFNGNASSRIFGGVMASSIRITEYNA